MAEFKANEATIYSGFSTGRTHGLVFKANEDIRVTKLLVKSNASASGVIMRLWDQTTQAAVATVSGVSLAAGWNYIALPSPVLLPKNSYHIVSLRSAGTVNFGYTAGNNALKTQDISGVTFTYQSTHRWAEGDAYPANGDSTTEPAMGVEWEIPNTPPNPPTGLSVSSVEIATPRLSWTFNDPDAGDTQSKFQIQVFDHTNMLTKNQSDCETDTTGFTAVGGASIAHTTAEKFSGSGSIQVVCPGAVAGERIQINMAANLTNRTYTGSTWVKGPAGKTIRILLREKDAANAIIGEDSQAFTLTGAWQRIHVTRSFGAAAANMELHVRTNIAEAMTFYTDEWMFNEGGLLSWTAGGNYPDAQNSAIHDTGIVFSANTYYDMPAGKIKAGHKLSFRVTTWDLQQVKSPDWVPFYWTTGAPYALSGSWESPVYTVFRSANVNNAVFTYDAATPAGTTLSASYRTSADKVNWSAWTPVANGGPIAPSDHLQLKFDFTTTDDFTTPELRSFNVLYPQEYHDSGEWVSPVIDTGAVGEAYKLTFSRAWASQAAGAGGTNEFRTSADGIAWTNWQSASLNTDYPWQRYVQLRITMRPTPDRTGTNVLGLFGLSAYTAYKPEGIWTSPPVDLQALDGEASATWVTSGNTAVSYRITEGGAWSAWAPIAASGPLSVDLSVVQQIQFEVKLTRVGPNETPEFDKLVFTVNPTRRKGYWTSEVIDVSQAKDRTTGKIASDTALGSDFFVTRFRYSTDGGSSFTEWTNTLADGSLPTPANTTHVQIMHVMLGNALEVKSSTLFFDGEPVAALLTSALTSNAEYDFAQLRDKLIIVNGSDAPRKLDSDGFGNLGGSPPVFKMVETHLNKVWGVERDNPSRVRWSDTLNPESWPALNFIDFNPEDGSEITALHRAGSYMLVGKSNSVALITGDRDSNFSVMWLDSHERGPSGPRSVATLDKYITYVGSDGIRISDLTKSVVNSQKLILTWEKEINHRRLNQAAVVYWDHYLLVALPSTGSLHNDTVWVLDTLRNAWSRINGWSVSCWLPFKQYGNEILLAGDSQTGQIYQVLIGDRDDDKLVEIDWLSGNLDLEYPERYKLFGNHTITVEGKAEPRTLQVFYTVIGGTTPDGEFFDGETVHTVEPIIVPAGEGQTHIYRILPPVWGAVLGRAISIRLITSVDVHSMTMDMTVKGIVPGGLA